ncbi:MAG: beta strand repeat-containing protein, partial [Phascolarctobacterium sp.]
DLNANAALANANGVVNENSSTGVDISLNKNNDGSVNADRHYNSQNVTVTPGGNVIVGSAIAVAVKVNGKEPSAGVAAATSVNDVTNSFTSSVAGSTISVSGVTDTATSTINAVKVKADNKTVMVAVAAGAAGTVTSGGTATVDVAGSGVANTINNDTIAKVENSTIAAPKLAVEATTNATLVGVAGQLSAAITDSYGGVAGLTWAQNSFDNTTGAYVRGISLNGYNNGNTALNVNALNNSDMYTVGAGVSVAVANGAISGAYAANYGTNSTEAVVEKYTGKDANDNDLTKNNTITNTSNVVVRAEDDSDIVAVAGSLDVAVSPSSAAATVGGVVANTQIGGTKNKQKVHASLDDTDITMVAGADLSVKALNRANIANFALGGGVAVSTSIVGVSAEGSVSVVDINSDCLASMKNVNVSGSNNDVELLAQSNGDIVSSADAVEVAYGSAAGVAGGAAVSVLNSAADTRVEATNTENYGTWNVKDAVINSISNNDIFNLAMGLGVGASATAGVGVEGNVAVNNISNNTTIKVEGASITAAQDLGILANSNEHLQNYGGAMSVGAAGTAGVSVGAAVVVNTISGDTSVEVNNSNLAAQGSKGANDGIDVYNYTVTDDGAVSSSSTKAKGLVIVADSKHEIDNVTVTSSIGGAGVASVGVGVTADVNEISGATKASVTNTNINKDANDVGDVYVLAHDKADISADVVNASGAGSGVGSATALGAAGTNIISRETRALIDGDTSTSATSQKVLNANNAKVYALGERRLRESVTGVGVAASGAGAGGLAATVSVVNLTDTNLAAVKNMAGTAHALTVDAERAANVHSYNNVIVATGGIGAGSAAVGVTVLDDKSSTQSMLTHTDLTHGGIYDTTRKVNVLANNNTHVETELGSGQISASIGAVGGVGVECVNMEALVGVTVDDATISKDASGHAYKEFNALANNRLYNKFTNAIASGSTLGAVMVGVGDVNINSKTFTNINNVNAHADAIAVKANEYRTAEAVFVAASVAAGLTVGVSQLYTNIGDVLQGEYTYYRGDNVKDESQKIGTAQTGKYTTANFQKAVDDGLNGNSQVIASLKQKYAADIKSTTSQSMNRGNVDNVGLSTTVTGSTLQATNALAIEAMVTNSVNNTLEQVQASLGIIAVASNHVSVVEHQSLLVENTSLVADTISINSNNTSALNSSVGTVPVGGTGYNDTTSYIKHSGDNELTVNGSNLKATYVADATTGNEEENSSNAAASLTINALNNTTINNSGHNVTVEGAAGGRLILEGEDASKATITLGNGTTSNSFKAAQIAVQAHNDPRVKNAVTTVNTGVLYGGGTIITSKAGGGAALAIKDKNTFEANEVALLALSGKDTSATDTNDIKNTTEATGTAVSVTGGDITVNKARTYNNMNTSLTIGAVKFLNGTGYSDVVLGAQNWTSSRAAIETYNIGIVGSGSNFAQTHDSSSVSINVNAGNEGIYANNLTINALNNGAVQANAKGTDAGLLEISPFAAQVEHEAASTTNITLSGTITASGNMLTNAQRTDTVNVFADALSMTVAGGGDASASSDISSSTYVKTDDAQLTSAGDMQLQAENIVSINKATGYEQMIYGQGSGVIKVDTAGVTNKVIAEAQVLVNDSSLLSKKGKIDIASHNQEDMNISGYIYSVGLISGCEADVENTITNYSKIDLDNSSISVNGTGNDLTISAADDLTLHTYAYSEVSPAVNLVNGTDANVKNELTRTNTIYVDNKSKLYGARDINLYAGKLLNGSLATLDLDVEACDFNASLIPVVLDPTVKNVINQNNQITISKGSSSGSARHTNLYADTGREIVRSYSCRYTGWGSSDVDGYVTTDSGKITDEPHVRNYVNINGSVVAGVANKVGITIGNTGDIVVLDDTDPASNLGSAERDAVIGTAYSGDELKERSTVIADSSSGLTVDSLVLGREDYANELMNRYNEVVCLMSEYERDNTTDANGNTIYSPSYLGYKAEAERLRNEMLTRGFAKETKDANGNPQLVLIANMKVDYVELPELVASGGNITVDTSNLQSSGKTGVLKAQGVDGVTITNNTNLLLKVNAITVDAEGGLLIYNKQEMTGSDVSSINSAISAINENNAAGFAEIKTVDTASEGSGAISITGTYSGASISFKDPTDNITKEYLPLANIQVQGNVTNNIGNVNITSEHNSIVVQGVSVNDAVAITGREVHLNAGGSIIQGFTDGIVHIGGNPQLNDTYKTLYEGLKQNHTTVEQNYSNSDYGDAIGNYISGGAVYINATDINVNGVIQSGYADYSVDITGSDVENKIAALKSNYNGTGIISDNVITSGDNYKIINGGAVWDRTKGAYKYQLNVYYNPSTDKIIVEDVDASGGQIYLTGRISSTGNGKILCLNGLSNITVNNDLDYVMQLGNLTVNETSGLVKITDTAGGFNHNAAVRVTTVTDGHTVRDYYDSNGVLTYTSSGIVSGSKVVYEPTQNLRYTWTSGDRYTTYTRYTEDIMDGGWGLWSRGATEEELAQWSVSDNQVGDSVPTGNVDRLNGETVVVTTSPDSGVGYDIYMKYSADTDSNVDYVKESEERYTSGFFGCHTHYVVTWTKSQGTSETYYASLKADMPFTIDFIGSSDSVINITSDKNNIELTGNIGNTQLYVDDPNYVDSNGNMSVEKGTVNIKANDGSIIRAGGSIYGQNITLAAAQDIENVNITAGDFVNLEAVNTASGQSGYKYDIKLDVERAHGTAGKVILETIGAATMVTNDNVTSYESVTNSTLNTGLVRINAEGDITQKNGVAISADRIDLNSEYGSIYGSGGGLRVYAGQGASSSDTLSASLNATAKGNISLTQLNGDMRLGRVYSKEGDVTLTVNNGSVVDALPYEDDSRGDLQVLQARWQSIGIIAGSGNENLKNAKSRMLTQVMNSRNAGGVTTQSYTYNYWNTNQLLYSLQNSIINQTSDNLPTTSVKDPNVIGKNITINAANGTVGSNTGTQTVITSLSNGNLEKLATANPATVTCVKDANGKIISATITDMQTIGIQQTVQTTIDAEGNKHTSMGNIVINSGDTDTSSGIFLEGREQDAEERFVSTVTKDLQLQNINAYNGNIYISGLGNIYKSLSSSDAVINGQDLYITAVGTIGDTARYLTTALEGTAENEGLSAIAGAGIYIDQKGSESLRLINVSSGGDICLSSDKSILMGSVGGTNAVNYVRAENGGDIVLEARDGSIGAPAYESNGTTIKHDENNGVRILNAKLPDASEESTTTSTPVNVTLRATKDIYVEGITEKILENSSEPSGYLNLQAKGYKSATLDNVGIVVNGQLNLLEAVNSNESISVYTTSDLLLNNKLETIKSKDIYVGSAGNVTINGAKEIQGTVSVTVSAGKDVVLNVGHLASPKITLQASQDTIDEKATFILDTTELNATAQGDILLDSHLNQLQQVNVSSTSGDITVGNGNVEDVALSIAIGNANNTINGDLLVHNYQKGLGNNIILADRLGATGDISIINEEANVGIGTNANINAKNLTLQATNHNVVVAGGQVTATEKVLLDGVDVIVGGGKIEAATVKLSAADDISMTDGEINVHKTGNATVELNAADDISLAGGKIIAATAILNAKGNSDNENNGSSITESDGFMLDVFTLQAKAVNAISLASKSNQLENVFVANTKGDVTIYNGNQGNLILNVAVLNEGADGAQINGNLVVHNYDDSGYMANPINLDKQLKATGDITIINDEAAIEVKEGASLTAQNITLQANNAPYNVIISGGTLTATSTAADAGVVSLQGNDVELKSGAINAKATDFTANVDITETEDFALVTPELNASATGVITLDSTSNQLEKVNILSSNNAVTIGSGNAKNDNDLRISTSNNVASLTVTNYSAGEYKNDIELLNSVTATGNIDLDNQEGIVNIGKDIQLNAANVSLSAAAGLTVNGSVQAQAAASLESGAGADLVLNGSGTVSGSTVNITSGQDFIHNGGTIAAVKDANIVGSGSATITAERNILLQVGSLQAGNATLTAVNGYITESYDKDDTATASDSYDLQVNQIQAAAGGADITGVAIDLGSRFNQLSSVVLGDAKGDVFIGNGAADSAGVLTIQAATIVEDNTTTYASVDGELVVHNYNNKSENDIGNNLRVLGSLNATEGISLINDERNITMGSLQATDKITSGGPIVIKAANNVRNAADIKSTGGAVSITAENDVINDGVVETASGEITLTSNNGMIFNSDNGDLLTNNGNVTLLAKGSATSTETNADYFYYAGYSNVANELIKTVVLANAEIQTEVDGAQKGRQYIMLDNEKHYVFRVGSVYNAGDIIAMNGDIILQSDNGNVANFNDFKSFTSNSINTDYVLNDQDITNGSITMSAVNGKLINNVNLEAGKDVTLIARDGLGSFGYDIYAGENITLTATAGNLVNTSTLESVKGNITLTAEHGNVINGTSESERAGDIISLGGTVT